MDIRGIYGRLRPAVFIGMLFFLLACEKEKTYLELSQYSINLSEESQTANFDIQCDSKWTLTSTDGWLSIDKNNGHGPCSVTITVEGHESLEPRNARITVSSGKKSCTLELVQSGAGLLLDTYYVEFAREGEVEYVTVSTNLPWTIMDPDDIWWCVIDPVEGVGNAVVTLTPVPITERKKRGPEEIIFQFGNRKTSLTVKQDQENENPSPAGLLVPGDGIAEVGLRTRFEWSGSVDPDGDEVYYTLSVSTDKKQWKTLATDRLTTYYQNIIPLSSNTRYYWKVYTRDDFGGSAESEIFSFTTESDRIYAHEESFVLLERNSHAPYPVHLLVTGDGFTPDDFAYGGTFETAARNAVEAFLSIEPYHSYKDLFQATAIAAYSEEKGATILNQFKWGSRPGPQQRNTYFGSQMDGGTSTRIECDYDKVLDHVKRIPGVTDEILLTTVVILLINEEIYAGSTATYPTGENISMIPLCPESFGELVCHEAAGHGFGTLADEYLGKYFALPHHLAEQLEELRGGDPWNYGANLSLTDDPELVHWSHFLDREEYPGVGFEEGGLGYNFGIWRPEAVSCMLDNSPYFNAPSRQAIVKRIVSAAGLDFDIEHFYKRDVHNPPAKRSASRNTVPLAPPMVVRK